VIVMGVGIVKDRNRFGHANAVLQEVDSGFAVFVPIETPDCSVRTICAYAKEPALGVGGAPAA
jgi:hypothetical protein